MGEKIRFSAKHVMERGAYIDTPEEMLSEFIYNRLSEAIIEEAKDKLEVELRGALKESIGSNFNIDHNTTTYWAGVAIEITPEKFKPLSSLPGEVEVWRNK